MSELPTDAIELVINHNPFATPDKADAMVDAQAQLAALKAKIAKLECRNGKAKTIINPPISTSQLRKDVKKTLKPHGLTVDEFLHSDIDDLESWELRDLWLMTKGALKPKDTILKQQKRKTK